MNKKEKLQTLYERLNKLQGKKAPLFARLFQKIDGKFAKNKDLNSILNSLGSLDKKIKESEQRLFNEFESRIKQMPDSTEKIESLRNEFEIKWDSLTHDGLKQDVENIKEQLQTLVENSIESGQEIKEGMDKELEALKTDFSQRLSRLGGGAANRQINVNSSVMSSKYTDVNLIQGDNITLTAVDDNTNKKVNITAALSNSPTIAGPLIGTTTATTVASQLTGGVDETLDVAYEAFRITLVGTEIGSVVIRLKKDEATTAGNVRALLYTDSSGPNTDISDTTTGQPTIVYAASIDDASYTDFEFRINKTGLSNGTNYWIVLNTQSLLGGNIYLERRSSGTGIYANDANGAGAWTIENNKEPYYIIKSLADDAITATSPNNHALKGNSTSGFGGYFVSNTGVGMKADSTENYGVGGTSVNGIGVRGSSTNNIAVQGVSTGSAGGQFQTTAAGQLGLQAVSTSGAAVQAIALDPSGPLFQGLSSGFAGVFQVSNSGAGSFAGDVTVPDEAYGTGWNDSLEVPTKNALYDKIQTIANDVLFDHFVDANNGTTVETDLYSDTLVAAQLANNGEKIVAQYGGVFVGDATSTQQLRAYFGGTLIFDSGALGVGVGTTNWDLYITIIRVSASVVRCSATLNTSFASLAAYAKYTEVTGLTLANTQVLKVTGTAAGVSGGSNQITAKEGFVEFKPTA